MIEEFEILMGININDIRDQWTDAIPKLLKYFYTGITTFSGKTTNEITVLSILKITDHFNAIQKLKIRVV